VAGANGELLIRDNFGGRKPVWNCEGVRQIGNNYRVFARKGMVIEGTLPMSKRIPEAPANAAQPVANVGPGCFGREAGIPRLEQRGWNHAAA
jgi:hypothetical protein